MNDETKANNENTNELPENELIFQDLDGELSDQSLDISDTDYAKDEFLKNWDGFETASGVVNSKEQKYDPGSSTYIDNNDGDPKDIFDEQEQQIPVISEVPYDIGQQSHNDYATLADRTISLANDNASEVTKSSISNQMPVMVTQIKYYRLLDDYNKILKMYQSDVSRLYDVKQLYKDGEIEYEQYSQFVRPITKMYMSLQKDYEKLMEFHSYLMHFNSLTDEQLSERLKSLKNELDSLINVNHEQDLTNIDRLGKVDDEISIIEDIIGRRENIAIASNLSDDELSNYINKLNQDLSKFNDKENEYDASSNVFIHKKDILAVLQNEQRRRHYASLTDEQIDSKISELQILEKYLNEWISNEHEANDIKEIYNSKLDAVTKQIETLDSVKKDRSDDNVPNFDMPKAPEMVIFKLEESNLGSNNDKYVGRPVVKMEDIYKLQREQRAASERECEKNRNKKDEKWYQKISSSIKAWFSKRSLNIVPSDQEQNSYSRHIRFVNQCRKEHSIGRSINQRPTITHDKRRRQHDGMAL